MTRYLRINLTRIAHGARAPSRMSVAVLHKSATSSIHMLMALTEF